MATPNMIPMIAPDGSTGMVPEDKVQDAIKAGGKLGVRMTAPDGSTGTVPMDRVHDAIKAGGQLLTSAPGLPQPQMQESTLGKVYSAFNGTGGTPGGQVRVNNGNTSRTVIVPEPGEDFSATMQRGVQQGQQHPEQVAASVQAEKDMGIGAAKSAGQTLETVGKFATLGIGGKSDDSALDAMNEDQQAGANLETILEYVAGDEALKSLNLSDKLAHVGRIAKFMEANPRIARILGEAIRSGTVGGAVGGVHDGTEGAVKGAAMGATLGGVTAGVGELLPGAKVTYASPEPDAAATQAPGLLRQITKGENSVQPEVQSTIRGAVKSAAEDAGTATEDSLGKIASEPIVNSSNGASTILDDHIAALQRQTKAAYKAVDDAVGFDLKAERQALSNDKYKLSQLGSTDADITQRGKLIEAINDSEDRIAEAQQKLTDAGIDPRAADALHQRLQATKQLKAKLITRYNPATDTFNVDGLLKDVQTLRVANKFGDRIEQALGSKEAADKFAQQLMSLKSQGVKAVKAQKIAKYVAYAVIGTGAAKVTGLASLLGGGR